MSNFCSIEGCERKYHAKGFCHLHYARDLRDKIRKGEHTPIRRGTRPVESFEGEIWRNIPGIDSMYFASTFGRIKHIEYIAGAKSKRKIVIPEALVSQHLSGRGYSMAYVLVNGVKVSKQVHRLVALSFLPNPLNKTDVNHKNGIKTDNRVENLEWATRSENIRHSIDILGIDRLKNVKKPVRCKESGEVFESIAAASKSRGDKYPTKLSRALATGGEYDGEHWEYYRFYKK